MAREGAVVGSGHTESRQPTSGLELSAFSTSSCDGMGSGLCTETYITEKTRGPNYAQVPALTGIVGNCRLETEAHKAYSEAKWEGYPGDEEQTETA